MGGRICALCLVSVGLWCGILVGEVERCVDCNLQPTPWLLAALGQPKRATHTSPSPPRAPARGAGVAEGVARQQPQRKERHPHQDGSLADDTIARSGPQRWWLPLHSGCCRRGVASSIPRPHRVVACQAFLQEEKQATTQGYDAPVPVVRRGLSLPTRHPSSVMHSPHPQSIHPSIPQATLHRFLHPTKPRNHGGREDAASPRHAGEAPSPRQGKRDERE